MTPETVVLIILIIIVLIFLGSLAFYKLPKRLNTKRYTKSWRDIQKKLSKKDQWGEAIVEADDLLDKAMKNKKIKGSSIGERLVEANKKLSDNDGVWYAHKLRKQIESKGSNIKLSKNQVEKALKSLRQALRDIGALK